MGNSFLKNNVRLEMQTTLGQETYLFKKEEKNRIFEEEELKENGIFALA